MNMKTMAPLLCFCLLAIPATWARAAGDATTPATAITPAQSAGDAPTPTPAAPEPKSSSLPFRLGLFFAKSFGQGGSLAPTPMVSAASNAAPAAVGLDVILGLGSSVRYHLGVAHEWESNGRYSAKGFRFDLISLGFPIQVYSDRVTVHIEPIARILRGEILFQSGVNDDAIFRAESGFGLAVTAAAAHWFVAVEPVSVDFRSFAATTNWVRTGFSHLWWFQLTAGREF
jgi:hypothetical protein